MDIIDHVAAALGPQPVLAAKKNCPFVAFFDHICRFTLCRAFDPLSFDPLSFDPVSFDPLSVNQINGLPSILLIFNFDTFIYVFIQ